MADPVTLEELYVRTARRVQAIEINEALSAEDRKVIADAYPGIYALLEGRGLAQWSETEDIPQRYIHLVTDLLAERVARDFQTEFSADGVIQEFNRQVTPNYRHAVTRFEEF